MEWMLPGAVFAYIQAKKLWQYNRNAWKTDVQIMQNFVHQEQNMRLAQASLYREDLRDLFNLTTSKMEIYTTVGTLFLGMLINLYYDFKWTEFEGRCPSWIFWIHALSLSCAFLFINLSIWLSVYASLCAQSYVVRVLTQAVRLPLPSEEALAFAGPDASAFEHQFGSWFRIPFLMGRLKRPLAPAGYGAVTSKEARAAPHFFLFRQVQRQWGIYDAYARVCMALGTYHTLQSLMYWNIAIVILDFGRGIGSILYTLGFLLMEYILIQLEVDLDRNEKVWSLLLVLAPPTLATVAANEVLKSSIKPNLSADPVLISSLALAATCSQLLWFTWLVHVVGATDTVTDQPKRLRAAKLLDIVSWLTIPTQDFGQAAAAHTSGGQTRSEAEHEGQLQVQQDLSTLVHRMSRWLRLFESAQRDLSEEHQQQVHKMRGELLQLYPAAQTIATESSTPNQDGGWIGLAYLESSGRPRRVWCHPDSGRISAEKPSAQPPDIVDLALLLQRIREKMQLRDEAAEEAEEEDELLEPLEPVFQLPPQQDLENERLLPGKLFRRGVRAMKLLWLLAIAGQLWVLLDSLKLTAVEHNFPMRINNLTGGWISRTRQLGVRPGHVDLQQLLRSEGVACPEQLGSGALIDELALLVLETCNSSMPLQRATARTLAKRLREEADLGDGCLSEGELQLWLVSIGAAPEVPCTLLHAEAASL